MSEKKPNKRSTGKLVVLNEEELIRQVALRPILYDRSLKSYRKYGLRLQYWKEVGNAMGATVDECRRRWRSLRDSFSKHYKHNNRDLTCTKRRKWVFYDQMNFIAPYLDNSTCEIDEQLLDDFSEDADGIILLPNDEQPEGEAESNQKVSESPVVDTTDYMKVSTTDRTSQEKDDDPHAPYSTTHNTYGEIDGDEKFLMSCAPVLRRLPAKKNALAKLKIQQILFDIEFGDERN